MILNRINNDKLKDKYSNENQTILIEVKYNNEEKDMNELKELLC